MAKIIQIAHLVVYLTREDVSREQKLAELKLATEHGVVTRDEALELCIEYI